MNGELAQVIALATHGTAWLRGPEAPPPRLDTTNSTFKFVHSTEFAIEEQRRLLRRQRRTTIGDVAGWLDRLKRKQMTRLWLVIPEPEAKQVDGHRVDAHMRVAFAGASKWLLLATGESHSEVWASSWQVGAQGAPDNRVWDVRYKGIAQGHLAPPRPPITDAGEEFRSALTEIRAFSREHELSPWTGWFNQALEALDADAPEPPYHPDMVPATYPAGPLRLMAAAAQSWVFGGMGSWNDLGFEPGEASDRYHELSRRLYSTMLTAFVAGVNAHL